ncbi:MAG TPA: glycerate kinase [Propionibacteriaceae bacterium]|nr:glycerate kinase [Propionibacteriaceae bacterium]
MRVVVATAAFAHLTPGATGAALARAWAGLGAEVAVVPLADAGAGFATAWSELTGESCVVVESDPPSPGLNLGATSASVGEALLTADPTAARLVCELPALDVHDGGAGMLAALGCTADVDLTVGVAGLAGITRLDLAPALGRLAGRELILVVPASEVERPLCGLRGITSVRGHAVGADVSVLLSTDQALVDLCAALGRPDLANLTGAGACGGVGAAVLALGGRVVSGPTLLAGRALLANTIADADLVVTGADQLDFATMGGAPVAEVVRLASEALRPVIAVARTNYISARELRTISIESAHSLAPAPDVVLDAADITEAATAVARSWSW